jgi:trans-2,3-dihydro-3-hydroxyanthranilate isomerase
MAIFKFHTLDVFTDRKFGGNPLAVVLDADGLTTEQMQVITREFNLSETTFVMKPADASHTAKVRIFFPGGEMPFAGHPTLGTAALLAELRNKPGCSFETTIRLELQAGLTPVRITRIADRVNGIFTAPVVPFHVRLKLPSASLVAQALGLVEEDIEFDGHRIAAIQGGPRFLFVPVKTRANLAMAGIREPYWSTILVDLPEIDLAYVYTRGGEAPDTAFRSRAFAPTGGIPEDPATGSATALLAAQLVVAEALGTGTHRFKLEQGYEMGRPSDLSLECDVNEGTLSAVRVGGFAVRMMSGQIEL